MFSLKKGVFYLFVTKVLVALTGLVTVILTSRMLGAEGRGQISLFTSSVALLQLFCDFGSSSVIINLSYRINQRNLWKSAILWVGGVCILSYIPVLFFRHIPFIFFVPPAAFLFSLLNINTLLLMGNLMVNRRNTLLILQPLMVLLLFLGFYFVVRLNVMAYPLAFLLSLLCSVLVSYLFIRKKLEVHRVENEKFSFEKELLTQGFWVQSGHAIQFLNYRIHFFLIIYFIGSAALGIYNNAIVIAESLWILGHSIGQILHMKILNTETEAEHRKMTNRMTLLNIAGTFLFLMVLLWIPASFWEWLFSKEFTEIRDLFRWLAPGIIFFSISNILNHYFHARNRFKLIVLSNLTGLISGLIMCLILIPSQGLSGACLAWSLGFGTAMLVYVAAYLKGRNHQMPYPGESDS